MKKLADYQGEEAIELWGDILDPLISIFTDEKIRNKLKGGTTYIGVAQSVIKEHKSDINTILLAIDPTPFNGVTAITRTLSVMMELLQSEDFKNFLGLRKLETPQSKSTGKLTESITDGEN